MVGRVFRTDYTLKCLTLFIPDRPLFIVCAPRMSNIHKIRVFAFRFLNCIAIVKLFILANNSQISPSSFDRMCQVNLIDSLLRKRQIQYCAEIRIDTHYTRAECLLIDRKMEWGSKSIWRRLKIELFVRAQVLMVDVCFFLLTGNQMASRKFRQ